MADLFPARFRQYAPDKPKVRKPEVAPVRFGAGWCSAECMFAVGEDCQCACGGVNHRAGFRCDGFTQQEIPL